MSTPELEKNRVYSSGQLVGYVRLGTFGTVSTIGIPYALLSHTGWIVGYALALIAFALVYGGLGQLLLWLGKERLSLRAMIAIIFGQLLCDVLVITLLIHLSGGTVSPYILLYLLPIFCTSFLFARSFWLNFTLSLFTIGSFELVLFLEFYGIFIPLDQNPWMREMANYLPQVVRFSLIVPLALWLIATFVRWFGLVFLQRRDELEAELQVEITRLQAELDKKLEKISSELKESEDKFSKAFQAIPFIIGISRLADGRYLEVNNTFLQVFGYKHEEVVGHSSQELGIFAEPADRERLKKVLQETGRISGERVVIRLHSGQTRTAAFFAQLIELQGEQCLIATVVDVTEQLQTEERFQIAFEYAPDAYYINDAKGFFIAGNQAAEKMTGYNKQELIGKNILAAGLLPPDQLSVGAALLAKNLLGQKTEAAEVDLQRKDGTRINTSINTYPVMIGNEKVTLGIARDISQRKLMEKELTDKIGELEKINKLMVGRELDMVNMKKEVNALLVKLGQPGKYRS